MKKFARDSFYENVNIIIDKMYTGDPKSYWRLVKRLSKQSGRSSIVPPLINNNNNNDNNIAIICTDDQDKACLLNNYFCSISTIDDRGIEVPDFNMRTHSKFDNLSVSETEIADILGILKLGKASGPDGISHQMLKMTKDEICKPLSILFNMSLQYHQFPAIWKKAMVLPLFKKGDRHEVSNYRPVSLISCVGKVFERVVFKHMYNFMFDNELFYKFQSGFLPNHSTVYQLIEIYDNICQSLEQKKHTCLVFCDISKAFDRVWHRGLVKKLKCYGFQGSFLCWLNDYLTDRMQQVIVNTHKSSLNRINAGVPQGSVLGPLLFLIYINDIADNLESLTRLFADDTSITHSSLDIGQLETNVNTDLSKLNDWSEKWLTTFNPSKTELLFISNTLSADTLTINFKGTVLQPVTSHRHLGVSISSDGKWTQHIENIYESCMKKVAPLRKYKHLLNKEIIIRIFKCFILPVLEYACEVWDGCTEQNKDRLESIQLEAARIACGLPVFCKKEYIYLESGLEPLHQRRERKKLVLFYKMHNKLVPSYLHDLLPPLVSEVSSYPLRNRHDYTLPNYRLSQSTKSFIPSTVLLWNSLESTVRNTDNLKSFKNQLVPRYSPYPFNNLQSDRKIYILHSRLRHRCSILSYDLFRCNLTESPSCTCGSPCENSYHFFFECPNYNCARAELLNSLRPITEINLDVILFGNPSTSLAINKLILQAVQRFIRCSNRF